MKICFIGNASIHTLKWIEVASEQGMDIVWIKPNPPGELAFSTKSLPPLKLYDLSSFMTIGGYFTTLLKAKSIVQKEKPDVIHAHYLTHNGIIAGLSKFPFPVVLSVWGTDVTSIFSKFPFNKFAKYALNQIDLVISSGEHLRQILLRAGVVREENSVNVPFGINPDLFSPSPQLITEREYDIISTRNHEAVYDLETLLHSVYLAKKQHGILFKTLLLGSGSRTKNLQQQAKELEISDLITFVGSVSHDEIPKWLKQAKFYVSCSLTDGTHISLLEGMGCELIPVVSDIRANRLWVFKDTGRLFETSNHQNLTEKLIELHKTPPNILLSMSKHNREYVQKHGSVQDIQDRLREYYSKAISLYREYRE